MTVTTPSSRMPAFSHFWIRRMMRRSPIRCSEPDQPVLTDFVEERSDVGVQYPVHLRALDPDNERIQRIVRAAPGSEPVRESEEVFLVDRVEHRDSRPLDDLILQGGNRERALSAVSFGNVDPPGRQC